MPIMLLGENRRFLIFERTVGTAECNFGGCLSTPIMLQAFKAAIHHVTAPCLWSSVLQLVHAPCHS